MRRKTTEEFKKELKEIQPNLEVLGEYINAHSKILIRDGYGECLVSPKNLLRGKIPTILTATEKTKYFIHKSRSLHGDKYDYSKVEYTSNLVKVNITCPIHGNFKQTPNDHIQGRGCMKCARESGAADYSLKSAEKRKEEFINTPAMVYLVKLSNDDESFVKIGITKNTIKERFNPIKKYYKVEVIDIKPVNLYDAIQLEHKLHSKLGAFRYIPNIKFGGRYECYTEEII